MKNYNKIIFVVFLVISIITILAIALSGIFINDSEGKGCMTVVDTSNQNNNNFNKDSQIKWMESFDLGLNESNKSNKPMFVYFSTSWCSYCKQLESETFTNQEIINKITENYIPVKIDGDTNPELCSRYNVLGFPTMVIIDSNEKQLDVIEGFHSPSELLNRLS